MFGDRRGTPTAIDRRAGDLGRLVRHPRGPDVPPSDQGPEFTAGLVQAWVQALAVETLFIERGSPWENGYVESFNGQLRDELLDREIFYTLSEAKILIEQWRRQYNTVRPHSALGYRPPAPETVKPAPVAELTMSFALS